MASEDRANDADRDGRGLDDRVSTFGEGLLELDDDELAERADEYLGFSESWGEDGG
jgi:hypothetical protein